MPPAPLLGVRRASPRCCKCLLVKTAPVTRPQFPPRLLITPPACRTFRATASLRLDVETITRQNHYERLGVKPDATPADIKRSFYRLSKSHHPDTNPSSPNAADLFSLLSESYTLLSNSSRRAAYDRDVLRLHAQHHSHNAAHPRGSYSSASQAGGRAPSGLSRRRTAFRGPPPSFYRSGGWGTQSDKRKKAHDESTGFNGANSSETSSSSASSSSGSTSSSHGGMGPGSDPFSYAYQSHTSDIPHFDRDGHKRTHEREDVRRSARAKTRARRAWGDDDIEFEPQTSIVGHFAIVTGILAVTFLAPFLYLKVVGDRKRAIKPGQQ